jgi:hypothetical protein
VHIIDDREPLAPSAGFLQARTRVQVQVPLLRPVASARGKGKGVSHPGGAAGRPCTLAQACMRQSKRQTRCRPRARIPCANEEASSIPINCTGYRDGPMHVLRTALFALLTAASCGYTY